MRALALCLALAAFAASACSQPAPSVPAQQPADRAHGSPEALVRHLYDLVTYPPHREPDWARVKDLFVKEAVVVLQTAKARRSVMSLDGFIDDLKHFADQIRPLKKGFQERVVRLRPMVCGDIAHVLTLYEAEVPGTRARPQQGVDSLQLIRRDGRWWIVSIVNEVLEKGALPPPELAQPPEK